MLLNVVGQPNNFSENSCTKWTLEHGDERTVSLTVVI